MTRSKTRLYVLSVLRNRKILSPLCLFCKVRLELVALVHSILIKKMIKKTRDFVQRQISLLAVKSGINMVEKLLSLFIGIGSKIWSQ